MDDRESGVDALYRQHVPETLRLACLLCGDRALAEDIVHDAFIRVAGRLRSLRDPAAFHAYLQRSVVNAVRSHYRRQAVERRYRRLDAVTSTLSTTNPDVESRDAVQRALQTLSERQREAIVCRYYLDMPEREIAAVLGCAPGTVKSSLARGLDAMRAVLEQEVER